MVIDQEPICQGAIAAYRRTGEQVRELRGVVEHFQSQDRPAFGSWLAANFGALLTELREVEARIDQQGPLLEAIRLMGLFGGHSPGEAYDEIMRDKAAYERRMARQTAGEPPEEGPEEDSDPDDPFEKFADKLDRMFGFDPSGPKSGQKSSSNAPGEQGSGPSRAKGRRKPFRTAPGQTPEQETAERRLKTAYRAAVRQLHPDLRAKTNAYDLRLWHEIQSAYARGDAEHLEALLTVSELSSTGTLPTGAGLGGLLSLVRQRETSISKLEQQVRGLMKDPAWNFIRLPSKDKLARRMGNRLRQDVAAARADLAAIEADLEFCRQAPRRPKKAAARGGKARPASRRSKRKR